MSKQGEPQAQEGAVHSIGDWTGQLPDETRATKHHRRAQGLWRSETLGWPAGPPTTKRTRETYPTLPNYLAERHDGQSAEDAGVNLMSEAARTYTRERLPQLEELEGTATRDRLYRNLLSSQPIAFSIAGELRAHPDAAAAVLGRLSTRPVAGLELLTGPDSVVADDQKSLPGYRPLEEYALDGAEAEWFPPRWAHTGDRSGFDIAACLRLDDDRRLLVSVEVKYTDSFSADPVLWDRYAAHLEALGLDQASTDALVQSGCSQVLRQVMITDSVRRLGLAPGAPESGRVDDALAVVLAREDDQRARDVVATLDAAVAMPVQFWSHADFLQAAEQEPALSEWARGMAARYLTTGRDRRSAP